MRAGAWIALCVAMALAGCGGKAATDSLPAAPSSNPRCHIAIDQQDRIFVQGREVTKEELKSGLGELCAAPSVRCYGEVLDNGTITLERQPVKADALRSQLAALAIRCRDLVIVPSAAGRDSTVERILKEARVVEFPACVEGDVRCLAALGASASPTPQ